LGTIAANANGCKFREIGLSQTTKAFVSPSMPSAYGEMMALALALTAFIGTSRKSPVKSGIEPQRRREHPKTRMVKQSTPFIAVLFFLGSTALNGGRAQIAAKSSKRALLDGFLPVVLLRRRRGYVLLQTLLQFEI
jgi:hypothetical protein